MLHKSAVAAPVSSVLAEGSVNQSNTRGHHGTMPAKRTPQGLWQTTTARQLRQPAGCGILWWSNLGTCRVGRAAKTHASRNDTGCLRVGLRSSTHPTRSEGRRRRESAVETQAVIVVTGHTATQDSRGPTCRVLWRIRDELGGADRMMVGVQGSSYVATVVISTGCDIICRSLVRTLPDRAKQV